ncbi:hypothetical protein P280DRAFT_467912 [Massarina eburnea CBS 473.64]|uniref:Uncharacterized protein n=1 Tax=Massarina eburnea CBS 473.64 TaxID=1395130 RepID=A0A6A6S761_9PLEO|nr:hypothetical protein P280DRAFT_467912 [Massarina eburnea CBS 473.64]
MILNAQYCFAMRFAAAVSAANAAAIHSTYSTNHTYHGAIVQDRMYVHTYLPTHLKTIVRSVARMPAGVLLLLLP